MAATRNRTLPIPSLPLYERLDVTSLCFRGDSGGGDGDGVEGETGDGGAQSGEWNGWLVFEDGVAGGNGMVVKVVVEVC